MIPSDNLKHLFAVAQRIILYDGRVVADQRTSDFVFLPCCCLAHMRLVVVKQPQKAPAAHDSS